MVRLIYAPAYREIERSGTKQNMECTCPTCQRSITIPEGGVNAIPQNLHLGFEVEVAGYMSKIGSVGEKSCDGCIDGSTGPAVVFCRTCHHLLCKLCHDNHKHSKIFYHHQLVGLDKDSIKLLPSIMKPTKHFCSLPHHEKEELKFFCETCQLLVCRDCILILHKDHRIADMCNIAKVHRDAMREALGCAQEVTSQLTRAIDANGKMAEQVYTSRGNATFITTQAFEQLHQTIEEKKNTLLSEMEAISLSKTTALTLQKEQLIEMTSNILQTHTDHKMVALGDLLPTELKATLKKVENESLTPNQSSDIHVTLLHIDSLIKELSIFGHVMDSPQSPSQSTWSSESVAKVKEKYCVKVESMISKGERYPHGGLLVKAEMRHKSVVLGEVEDHGDGTYTITSPLRLLVLTSSSSQWMVTMYRTVLVTLIGDIYVACIDNHSIHVFDQAGQQKRTIGGQFLQKFGQRRSGLGQFQNPVSVIVDQRDRLIVSDSRNHRVVLFDQAGTWLLTINGNFPGSHGFLNPYGVALDPQGNIHVTAMGSNTITVFTPEGTYVRSYGDVKGLTGMVIDEEGYSLVTEYLGNCVSIFDSQGNKVHTVGNLNGP
eukprot:Em0020g533a